MSQFLAKVLEQLSITTWMPAIAFVGIVTVMFELSTMPGPPNLSVALVTLSRSALGILVVLLFAIIIATLALQAFEFEIVRLLEGYPGNWLARTLLFGPLIVFNSWRRDRLSRRLQRATETAFARARRTMLTLPQPISLRVVDALEAQVLGVDPQNPLTEDEELEAAAINWQYAYVKPRQLHYLEALDARLSIYPTDNRVMPTRLGNVLRSVEDKLEVGEDENVEGFVLRHLSQFSDVLLEEFKTYRARLEMYAPLAIVMTLVELSPAEWCTTWR